MAYHQDKKLNFIAHWHKISLMVLFGCIIVIILLIKNGQSASIGLVRIANIKQLTRIAFYLQHAQVNQNTHIHVVCYHARQLLILRNRLERRLDKVLKRSEHDEQLLLLMMTLCSR